MTRSNSSLVLNKETSTPNTSALTYAGWSRRFCYPEYLAAERVYGFLDARKDKKRSDVLSSCRSSAWFARHRDTGEVRVAANSCHLRWCPVCAKSKRNYISHEVANWVRESDHPKFVTLTMKHSTAPLAHQVYWLYRHFQVLRRRKDFRDAVPGGIWFFQIKKSVTDHLWHPHLHLLIVGDYVPRRRLSYMWSQVTFGSTVIDIRTITDPDRASRDAARYAACPGSLVGLSLDDACELVGAMHGRRICGTWGTGRAVSLRPAKLKDRTKWEDIGGFSIVYGCRNTDDSAAEIWKAWNRGTALDQGIRCTALEDYVSGLERFDWNKLDLEEVYESERSPPE